MSRARSRTAAARLCALLILWPASPALLAHGDLHDRIVEISAQIERQPASSGLIFKRAELHRHHGDWPAALAAIDSLPAHLRKATGQLETRLRGQLRGMTERR